MNMRDAQAGSPAEPWRQLSAATTVPRGARDVAAWAAVATALVAACGLAAVVLPAAAELPGELRDARARRAVVVEFERFEIEALGSDRKEGLSFQRRLAHRLAGYDDVELVSFARAARDAVDDDLRRIRWFDNLHMLDVARRDGGRGWSERRLHATSAVTDAGLRHLEGSSVAWLDLGWSAVTSEGMRHLVHCPRLERLDLTRTAVDDSAVIWLVRMPSLREVNLTSTAVTPEAVAFLRGTGLEVRLDDYTGLRKVIICISPADPGGRQPEWGELLQQVHNGLSIVGTPASATGRNIWRSIARGTTGKAGKP